MRRKGFTIIELSVVSVILGILSTMAVVRFWKVGEKAKAMEAELILEKARAGYQARVFESLPVTTGGAWDPNIPAASDPSWRTLGMANPNSAANGFFAYDYWASATSAGSAPVNAARNVVVAFRRNSQVAYTNSYNASKWIYMDMDTGQVFKSTTYR